MRVIHRRLLVASLFACVLALSWAVIAATRDSALAAHGQPDDISVALARADIEFAILDATQIQDLSPIAPDRAVEVARRQFGPAGSPTLWIGQLTVRGYHTGDETTPLVIENRFVYAVQVTGLELPPAGVKGTAQSLHHELIVFVDLASGDYLLATSVR